jgi:uncharacterized protein YjbI with pentapeptide repeats
MPELSADCTRCVGLCCVAAEFATGADFPVDKPAGTPCVHLGLDFRCGVHDQLRPLGFRGCAAFDCHGAGQRLTESRGALADWRAHPEDAQVLFADFSRLRALHGLLWHLAHASERDLRPELTALTVRVEAAASGALAGLVLLPLLRDVGMALRAWSASVRGGAGVDLARADRVGADLRGADLRGGDLFAALLLGADLRDADLRGADLRGADLRGADLRGADLRGALFLQASQLASARTGPGTRSDVCASGPV